MSRPEKYPLRYLREGERFLFPGTPQAARCIAYRYGRRFACRFKVRVERETEGGVLIVRTFIERQAGHTLPLIPADAAARTKFKQREQDQRRRRRLQTLWEEIWTDGRRVLKARLGVRPKIWFRGKRVLIPRPQ